MVGMLISILESRSLRFAVVTFFVQWRMSNECLLRIQMQPDSHGSINSDCTLLISPLNVHSVANTPVLFTTVLSTTVFSTTVLSTTVVSVLR
jgi:hypothetical protein